MPLTELQRKTLIDKCNSININTLMSYIQSKDVTLADMPKLSAERRAYIEQYQHNMPNAQEQSEWNEIAASSAVKTEALLTKIKAYISRWESERPTGNHVDEARTLQNQVEAELSAQQASIEQGDWNMVDVFSAQSLLAHLQKYPHTTHRQEIEEAVWNCTNKENAQELQSFVAQFSGSMHAMEAQNIMMALNEWSMVKSSSNLVEITNYVKNHPQSPFLFQAQAMMMSMKQNELENMKRNGEKYEKDTILDYISTGLFSESELFAANVLTPQILDTLRQMDKIKQCLPNVQQNIESSKAVCKEGCTDVFFWGIPSTGKTCVLMGLSCASNIHINLASAGGDYGSTLMQYTQAGFTIPATPGNFVTTLEASIHTPGDTDQAHHVNLVEMSGEEFAFQIVNNPNHEFSFEDMGAGATELLKGPNRKLFFIVIDPTADRVSLNRKILVGYDGETGEPKYEYQYATANQRIVLQKLVDLFSLEENKEIMKKVDGIHFIMTKSDRLAKPAHMRMDAAMSIFKAQYEGNILGPLKMLCERYNINTPTKFHPELFTFSLGDFYPGKIFKYNPTDADMLANAIQNSTHAIKNMTWWGKFKNAVN